MAGTFEYFQRGKLAKLSELRLISEMRKERRQEERQVDKARLTSINKVMGDPEYWWHRKAEDFATWQQDRNETEGRLGLPPTPMKDPREKFVQTQLSALLDKVGSNRLTPEAGTALLRSRIPDWDWFENNSRRAQMVAGAKPGGLKDAETWVREQFQTVYVKPLNFNDANQLAQSEIGALAERAIGGISEQEVGLALTGLGQRLANTAYRPSLETLRANFSSQLSVQSVNLYNQLAQQYQKGQKDKATLGRLVGIRLALTGRLLTQENFDEAGQETQESLTAPEKKPGLPVGLIDDLVKGTLSAQQRATLPSMFAVTPEEVEGLSAGDPVAVDQAKRKASLASFDGFLRARGLDPAKLTNERMLRAREWASMGKSVEDAYEKADDDIAEAKRLNISLGQLALSERREGRIAAEGGGGGAGGGAGGLKQSATVQQVRAAIDQGADVGPQAIVERLLPFAKRSTLADALQSYGHRPPSRWLEWTQKDMKARPKFYQEFAREGKKKGYALTKEGAGEKWRDDVNKALRYLKAYQTDIVPEEAQTGGGAFEAWKRRRGEQEAGP